jgi:hypothetical protein
MNHHEEAPKLSKLPFIVGDLLLIATAVLIANRSEAPLSTGAVIAITACIVLGAALLVIPFLADYARRADADLAERQDQIAALARTTAESADQLGIVASGLNGIAESSKHNLGALEKLPAQLKTRIDDITQQLAGSTLAVHSLVKEDVARLEATTEKLTRLLAQLETTAHSKTDALAASESALTATLARATDQLDAFIAKGRTGPLEPPPPSLDTPAPPRAPDIVATPDPAPVITAAPAADPLPDEIPSPPFTPAEPTAEEVPVNPEPAPEAPKPPRARKPKPADDIPDLGLTPDAPEPSESALTSDGFTRLVATAYIGIGNKLYIRGDGPGLSWDKGLPLQFVSIGKWRWETPDATAPITAKLYKNDQIECTGLGTLTLEPGHQHEVNAGF